jgi:TolA-binding protein
MALLRQWLLIFFALFLGGGPLWAASTREDRAFAAAAAAFQDENWSRAETGFARFVERFPKSERVPQAVLSEAQAQFKQGKYAAASALLTARAASSGLLVDRYAYWLGEAQFASGDYTNAAATFSALANNFPDSQLRLTAVVEAAAAYAQFPDWARHDALLEATNGVFANAAQMDPDNALVINGRLSLAQSKLAQTNFTAAGKFLDLLNPKILAPEQDWERLNLLYQVKLGLGDLDAALAVTTNLMQSATTPARLADSVAMQATVLEKKNLLAAAVVAWSENLTNSAPVESQRAAVLNIAALAAAQNDVTNATASLQNYLAQFPNSPVAELVLLTLGELHLKGFMATAAPDQLAAAQTNFDQFIGAFTNSPLTGKACLDRGWCNWTAEKFPESLVDFRAAAQRLPVSEDLAVAKFKTGDALFALKDFSGARQNYQAVLEGFDAFPEVAKSLGDRVLYQILRADLELQDAVGADAVMRQLLEKFPASEFADHGLLLLGEGFSDFSSPTNAQRVFSDFARQFPQSALTPQVKLAVARTFEREQNWPAAITNYEGWLKNYPTNELIPQVQFALGWANYQAGRETNAFQLFTAFVTQFPADTNAPLAQWWVADHFYRAGNFIGAETNYEVIYQTPAWKNSTLFYPAQLMAARAAAGRLGFDDARNYLTKMLADTNCPPPLATQAMFAYGGVLMRQDSSDTNQPFANFELATNVFAQICTANPTNETGALAGSELGDCYLQLGALDAATNAYAQVVNSPYASASARSRSQVGIGIVLEKMAALATGTNQVALFNQALNNYSDVLYENNLRDGEQPDPLWRKKAGLQAAGLAQTLADFEVATNIYSHLEELFPQSKDSLEKKKAAMVAAKPDGG